MTRPAGTGADTTDPKPLGARDRWAVPLLFIVLASLFAATASWGAPYNVDAFTNALQARTFAAEASPIVEAAEEITDPQYQGSLAWFVDSPDGPTSQYPPGVALWGAAFYMFDSSVETTTLSWANEEKGLGGTVELELPSLVPAGAAAIASVLVAMAFLHLTVSPLVGRRRALVTVAVAALGTGAWSVASDKLWQHGPAMMMISAGTYLASRNRFVASGLAFGGAILIRPHTGLIAAAVGITVGVSRRELWPVLKVGLASAVGLAAVVAYNAVVFGSASISGGYGDAFSSRVTTTSPITLAERLVGVFVDPSVGMLWTSPFLLIAIVGAWKARKTAPDWAIGGTIGATLYLLVQMQANRVSGGSGFFSYRYPLEALMAAAPLFALGVSGWVEASNSRQRMFTALAAASMLLHGLGAVTT